MVAVYWVLPSFTGFDWIWLPCLDVDLLNRWLFTGFYRALSSWKRFSHSIGFYRVSWSLIGFDYLVETWVRSSNGCVLGFTEFFFPNPFHWVLPSFIAFDEVWWRFYYVWLGFIELNQICLRYVDSFGSASDSIASFNSNWMKSATCFCLFVCLLVSILFFLPSNSCVLPTFCSISDIREIWPANCRNITISRLRFVEKHCLSTIWWTPFDGRGRDVRTICWNSATVHEPLGTFTENGRLG